jgi:hypothetical protein
MAEPLGEELDWEYPFLLLAFVGMTVNATKAFARSPVGPIIPELRLHCLIRYIAGGSYLDLCTLVSSPHSTFFYSLWKTCDAINASAQLAF